MNIKEKALLFAINAHKGQVRKSEPEKPLILHPISVGILLEEYGFDDNVVAAGFLHDVVEDTKYTRDDIYEIFGDDICSLVMGASEEDKSLSWEERKRGTINKIGKLDLRHKAIIACDKIDNTEDLYYMFKRNNREDYSSFNRGKEKKKWYWEEGYKKLVLNEDKNSPMFVKLKNNIDNLFYCEKDDYLRDNIFKERVWEYEILEQLKYRMLELKKLRKIAARLNSNMDTYVVEFTGSPRCGKTTLIDILGDLFEKDGFNLFRIDEFVSSVRYKNDIYPNVRDKSKLDINKEIIRGVEMELDSAIGKGYDVILFDRGIFDRVVWFDRLYCNGGVGESEYRDIVIKYLGIVKEYVNKIISLECSGINSVKRDYYHYLSLVSRNFITEDNVMSFNNSLVNVIDKSREYDLNVSRYDTDNLSEREVSFLVSEDILGDMRRDYLKNIHMRIKKM